MIRVQGADFEPGAEIDRLLDGHTAVGGVASFIGVVRDDPEDGPALRAMTLEHYPGMTERMLEAIEQEANQRWDLCASLIVHRYGRMVPGDRIVLVVTAARHRQAALESCQFSKPVERHRLRDGFIQTGLGPFFENYHRQVCVNAVWQCGYL